MSDQGFRDSNRFSIRYQLAERNLRRAIPESDSSMHFDLAASALSDDELEMVGGGTPEPGWGFSDILQDLISRDNKTIPTNDLASLQDNLKDLGYLDPDQPTTGEWDPISNAAFRRFESDNYQSVRQGNHPLAAPVLTGLRTLGYVMPASVLSGVLGAAKGIAQQTGETFERAGALGGAAAGGAIGASVGSVLAPFTAGASVGVGAAVGAVVGGIGGFLSDFFGSEEGEDESMDGRFWDALTPFDRNEWGTAKNFFEDLGYVLSASSLIKGGALALGGARAGATAIGAAQAEGAGLAEALFAKQGAATPGWFARITASAMKPVSSGAGETWLKWAAEKGLNAQMSRPLLHAANETFSGLATINVGSRLAGGLGSGEKDTTIERAFKTVPDWADGPEVELPGMGKVNLLDNTLGWVMFSSKFLPLKEGELRNAAQVALTKPVSDMFTLKAGRAAKDYIESGVALKPYVNLVQKHGGTVGDARVAARAMLGSTAEEQIATDMWLRLDYWAKRTAGEAMLNQRGEQAFLAEDFARVSDEALAEAEQAVIHAVESGDQAALSSMLAPSHQDFGSYAAYLEGLEGIGSPLERMGHLKEGHQIIRSLNESWEVGTLNATIYKGLTDTTTKPFGRQTSGELKTWRANKNARQKEVERAEKRLARTSLGSPERERLERRLAEAKAQLEEIKAAPPETKTFKRDKDFTFTIARKYETPDASIANPGHHGYSTEQDILELGKEYDRQRQLLKASYDTRNTSEEAFNQYVTHQKKWDDFVQDLEWRGLLKPDEAVKLKVPDPNPRVSQRLERIAPNHGKRVKVEDDGLTFRLDELGYQVIATRRNHVLFDQMDKVREALKVTGVGEYTRRAAFFETLGMSPFLHEDRSLFKLRIGNEESELQQVMAENGMKMTGRQAGRKLHDKLNTVNHETDDAHHVIAGPLSIKQGDEALLKRTSVFRSDTRQLKLDEISDALHLDSFDHIDADKVSQEVYDALKRGASLGGETSWRHPIESAQMLGKAIRVNGLPGFSDWMRTFHTTNSKLGKPIVGAAVGGTLGYYDSGWDGALKGGALGAIGGAGWRQLVKMRHPKGSYGYLPDRLHNLNMALRYTLSPAFDAGRYMEQNIIGATYGLPAVFRPKAYITKKYGADAWDEALDLLDRVNGTKGLMRVVDDTDRRMFQRGVLGYSPRYHEAAKAFMLYKQGKSLSEIEQIVSKLERYGMGRTAAEKSVNFIFFPFSFQKKLAMTLGNAVIQAPARALLVHEGIRRFYELDKNLQETPGSKDSLGARIGDFLERHAPLVQQLSRLNNLAYGISPGRFFLEGVGDHRTDAGGAAQVLTSVFVPSGAATPIAQMMGGVGDKMVHFFTPIAVTGEDMDSMSDLLSRYVPAVKDLFDPNYGIFSAVAEQATAIREGATPYVQLQDYLTEKRMKKDDLEPMALALGYSSVDGLFASDVGQTFKAKYDAQVAELNKRYPTGFAMATEFTNTSALNKQALVDLAERPDRSEAEDAILEIAQIQNTYSILTQITGLPISASRAVRKRATEFVGNRRFVELWDMLYASDFGPLRMTVAA